MWHRPGGVPVGGVMPIPEGMNFPLFLCPSGIGITPPTGTPPGRCHMSYGVGDPSNGFTSQPTTVV